MDQGLSNVIKCQHNMLPMKYLGLALGGDQSKSKLWSPITEKIKSKLSMWQCKHLSNAGRNQLIKSVLSNLSSYFLSIYKFQDVAKQIISLETKFF